MSLFSRQLKDEDVFRWAAFMAIALAVVSCYFPSLFFPPRADQVTYLAEVATQHGPHDLILDNYDFNRHRVYSPGDELLFRPLLYMLLGAEQWWFGHHFWAWQGLGILAHLVLIWVLLRLLWRLCGPWPAFAAVWVFALNTDNFELITWPHLTAYIFMMTLVILGVEQVVFCLDESELSWGRMGRILIYMSMAGFIYETANLFLLAFLGLFMVCFPRQRSRALVLIVPLMVYVIWSFCNYIYVNHISIVVTRHGVSLVKYLWSIVYVGIWWFYEGVFNSLYPYLMNIRTMFQRADVLTFKPLVLNWEVILSLVNMVATAGLLWINRRVSANRSKLVALLTVMAAAYVAVIVLGRYEQMGSLKQAIRINTYYLYLFWVLVVLIVFGLLEKIHYEGWGRWFLVLMVASSFLLGADQGRKDYTIAAVYNQVNNGSLVLVKSLDLIIKAKGQEPDFSFYVHPHYPGNYTIPEVYKKNDPVGKVYSFAELIFPQYYRPQAVAKYKLLIKKP